MSTDVACPAEAPTVRRRPIAHYAGPFGLFSAEAVALGLLFNPAALARDEWLFSQLGNRLVAATPAALLLAASWLVESRRAKARPLSRPLPLGLILLGQALAFSGFLIVLSLVERSIDRSSAYSGAWLWALMLTAATALVFGVVALLPDRLRPVSAGSVRRFAMTAAPVAAICMISSRVVLQTRLTFWEPLSRPTLWAAYWLLALILPDVLVRPSERMLGTPSFTVTVNWPCAGYEGIGILWVFLAAYLWLFRRDLRFPQALLLVPLGTVLIWVANVVRIVALVLIGVWMSPDVALGGFHSQAGWVIFNAVALGLVVGSRYLGVFTRPAPRTGAGNPPNPVAPYTVPLLVIFAGTMITGAFSSGFDRFYPVRVVSVAAALWYFRRAYAGWSWSWGAVAIGAATFALWVALEPATAGTMTETALASGLARMPAGLAVTWLVFRVIGSAVTVPIAEELAFRGYLTRWLVSREFQNVPLGRFTWLSFVVSSALFGLLHGRWLAGTLVGMLYALALYRRGELGDAVAAHATTNALLSAYVLATSSWSLWV